MPHGYCYLWDSRTSELHRGSTFSFTLPIFSLADLITPVLTNHKRRLDPVALVVVELSCQNGWSSKAIRRERLATYDLYYSAVCIPFWTCFCRKWAPVRQNSFLSWLPPMRRVRKC